jgi:hypothetical protein
MRRDVGIRLLFTGAIVWACIALPVQGQNPAKSEDVLPKILVNAVELGDFRELNQSLNAIEQPTCTNSRDFKLLTMADLVGGKVNLVRVSRTLRRYRNPPNWEPGRSGVRCPRSTRLTKPAIAGSSSGCATAS